ncbi:hypothetical protein SLA2020_282960 [Shorea laevis]
MIASSSSSQKSPSLLSFLHNATTSTPISFKLSRSCSTSCCHLVVNNVLKTVTTRPENLGLQPPRLRSQLPKTHHLGLEEAHLHALSVCSSWSRRGARGEVLFVELISARDDRSEGLLRDNLRIRADGVQLCR